MAMEEICFPNNIRKIRMAKGIKMTPVAKHTGLSLSAMSKIEKGYRRMNQKQLLSLCEILDCKLADVFIKEDDKDIADTWKGEMQRRVVENESAGLKIFGSGLRYIRKKEHKTIAKAAKDAKLTLSVYHRIEVGQRDVYEDELERLAKAVNRQPEVLVKEIYELYEGGKLKGLIDKSEEKVQSVLIPGSPMNGINLSGSLYGAKIYELTRKKLVPIFGMPGDKVINFKKSEEKMVVAPSSLEGRGDVYAIIPVARRLNNVLPQRSYLFIDTEAVVQPGDLAVLFNEDFSKLKVDQKTTAQIVSVREDIDGKLFGVLFNPDEKIPLDLKKTGRLHKVVQIAMD